jgi:hypothetical protein
MSRNTRSDQKEAQRRRTAVKLYRSGTPATEVARQLHRSRCWANPANTSFPPLVTEADRIFPDQTPSWNTPFFGLIYGYKLHYVVFHVT